VQPITEAIVVLQARMSSSRFPGKVMSIVNGKPIIEWQIRRIQNARTIKKVVVATSTDPSDDILADYLTKIGVEVYRGDLNNVIRRYVNVIEKYKPRFFIRLTGDCPLVMPELIDKMVDDFESGKWEYMSNALEPSFPDGLDIEVVESNSFLRLSTQELTKKEIEHVTLGMYSRFGFASVKSVVNDQDFGYERWTLDYPEDLDFIRDVYSNFEGREADFMLVEVYDLLLNNSKIKNKIPSTFRNIAISDNPKQEIKLHE
jgi:spore coat polysaccharide biosynthesis protein SpsF